MTTLLRHRTATTLLLYLLCGLLFAVFTEVRHPDGDLPSLFTVDGTLMLLIVLVSWPLMIGFSLFSGERTLVTEGAALAVTAAVVFGAWALAVRKGMRRNAAAIVERKRGT